MGKNRTKRNMVACALTASRGALFCRYGSLTIRNDELM